jgi:hypothetical protein
VLSPSLTTVTAVTSPALSVTSWLQIDNIYQQNIATTSQVIKDFLNSPHNTWNYPSLDSDCPSPCLNAYSPPPFIPTPVFPDPTVTPPNFLDILANIALQQAYVVSP